MVRRLATFKMKEAIVWGASGHAKVLRPVIEKAGFHIGAMIDRNSNATPIIPGCPVFSSLEDLVLRQPKEAKSDFVTILRQALLGTDEKTYFAIAIGGDRGKDRLEIHRRLTTHGFFPITIVHPKAWVAETAQLGEGAQVLGMAAVSEEAKIGRQSIVNTNASVDHECMIGEGCHIMPGATLAGCVTVGDFCTIGSNATVFPRVRIGSGAFVGAGSVVTKDVPENTVVIGAPARPHRARQ
jgi:sugar O-acyltransferase (sialic acid O-acetyltransferase NeuD family)